MMKNTLTKLSIGVLMATGLSVSPVVMAEESPISANVALTSNYIYRGLQQYIDGNGNGADRVALQGGFDYSHDSGVYAGVWGSSVYFRGTDKNDGDVNAPLELDFYAGYAKELENGLSFDVGYLYYMYDKDATDLDMSEVYLKVGFKGFGFQYSEGLSNDYDIPNYMEVSYAGEFKDIGYSVTYGDSEDSNTYYKLGVSKSIAGLDFSLDFIGTEYEGGGDDTFTVLTVGKSF
jgi:uncharacterized protein (TIGR02001 family)